MKNLSIQNLLLTLLMLVITNLTAQQEYTIYDDAPGNIKSYKPSYNVDFPDWAKLLYTYPVNYNEICAAFDQSKERNEKTAITRYFKNWRRNISPWVSNNGSIILPDLEIYHQKLYQSQKQAQYNSQDNKSTSDWTFLGPKNTYWLNESGSATAPGDCPWQVNIYSFDVSPSDNDVLYCGTETHFMNKSIDYGISWTQIGVDYPFGGGITATLIHPNNPDIVYVSAGGQIHKTIDGGISWTPLLPTDALFSADRLIVDPNNPDKIFAAANNGVYVTTDGGENWERNWLNRAYDVAIQPNNSNKIFAITKIYGKFAIAISNDGGLSFEEQSSFPSNIVDESGGLLAVTPADPNMILAVMLSSNNTPYIYKGDMSNGSWDLLATGQTSELEMNNGQGYFDLVLEISPTDPDIVFVGTTTMFKSSDGGAHYHVIGGYYGSFATHPDFQDIKILPNGDTWVSTDGGMNYSFDYFSNVNNYFSRTNGIIGSDMWGFDQGWNEDVVVGGRYHNGNTAMADFYGDKSLRMGGAESPTGWVLRGESRHVAFNDLGNGWILPQTAEGQPEGRFIFSKYPNMDEYGGRRGNLVFHPNYYGHIILGEGNGIWKSTDMGITYDLLHSFNHSVRFLQISYHNPDVLYVDVINEGLYRSADGGQNWELKPSLCSSEYGGPSWKGKLFFVISPNDENSIYACLQNGTWSSDIGEIFHSTDGGDTWVDWTSGLTEYTKDMVIQPDADGNDIVYLFTNSRNGETAKVFKRKESDDSWALFNDNYPAGFYVNLALPFYRDSKIRVGGSGGVWESPMAEEDFLPIINPWVEKAVYNCFEDTLFFDDHSILNHENTSWHWEINPEPAYMEDADIRNPKVVLGAEGSYDVQLTVTKNGLEYSKEINSMVSTSTCPSIYDCSNPAEVPKNVWELVYVDSEEVNSPGLAIMAFDEDFSTIWHTRWSTGNDLYPHEIQVDMGETYLVSKFIYYTRQDGSNGRIKEYELYISDDIDDWGEAVSIGEFVNTAAPQTIVLNEPKEGRFFRLVALSEVNGNPWASAAEFSVVGCIDNTGFNDYFDSYNHLSAFPIPTSGLISVALPNAQELNYSIVSASGKAIEKGQIHQHQGHYDFDLSHQSNGVYILLINDTQGRSYRVKMIKK